MTKARWAALAAAVLVVVAIAATKLLTGLGPVAAVNWARCDLAAGRGQPCSIVPELDRLCAVAAETAAGTFPDDAARALHARDALEAAPETRAGRHLLALVIRARPEQRLTMLRRAAEASGAPGWSCPALEALLGPRTNPEPTSAPTRTSTAP